MYPYPYSVYLYLYLYLSQFIAISSLGMEYSQAPKSNAPRLRLAELPIKLQGVWEERPTGSSGNSWPSNAPGKPMACNYGRLSFNYGLLWGTLACDLKLLVSPGSAVMVLGLP